MELLVDYRYSFQLFVCVLQAASMFQKFYSPNILSVASSLVGEDSLSHHVDPAIGTYTLLEKLWRI